MSINVCPYTQENINSKSKNNVFSFTQKGKLYKFNKTSILTDYKYSLANRKPFLNPLTRLPVNSRTLERLNRLVKNKSMSSTNKLTNDEKNVLKDLITFFVPNKTKSMKISKVGNMYLNNMSQITNKNNLNKISKNINSIINKIGNNINFSTLNFTQFK